VEAFVIIIACSVAFYVPVLSFDRKMANGLCRCEWQKVCRFYEILGTSRHNLRVVCSVYFSFIAEMTDVD